MAIMYMTKYSSSVTIEKFDQILIKVLCHSSKYANIKI